MLVEVAAVLVRRLLGDYFFEEIVKQGEQPFFGAMQRLRRILKERITRLQVIKKFLLARVLL